MQFLFVLQGSCIPGKLKNIAGYLKGAQNKRKQNTLFVAYL